MSKVKTFFWVCAISLLPHSPLYESLLKKKFSYSVKYLVYLSLFLYYLFIIGLIIKTGCFVALRSRIDGIQNGVQDYPQDLVITVQNGRLTTNYNRPYFLWMRNGERRQLLAVVDETGQPEKIRSYGALALATAKNVSVLDKEDNRVITFPFQNKNLTITKSSVNQSLNRMKVIFRIGSILLMVFVLSVLPTIMILALFGYACIASCFAYIISKFVFPHAVSHKVGFSKTFQVSLHAITLPLFISFLISELALHSRSFALLSFILYVTLICIGVYHAYHSRTS